MYFLGPGIAVSEGPDIDGQVPTGDFPPSGDAAKIGVSLIRAGTKNPTLMKLF